jgi:hypothetical protein
MKKRNVLNARSSPVLKRECDAEKMNWLNILHFYQPPFQDMEIVKQVTEECYLPVSRMLRDQPHAKALVNINGCLLELLNRFQEGKEAIENLRILVSRGQVEVTGTGKYHPILPLIETKEIKIQVLRQEMSLHSFLGLRDTPAVLFLPELAYRPEQIPVFEELGYHWIIIDEVSLKNGKRFMGRSLLREKGGGMNLLVRERDLSESLCNFPWRKYDIRTPDDFAAHSRERMDEGGFIVTASDAEVFGHHQKGRWELLSDIYDSQSVTSISVREIADRYPSAEVETVPASWSTSRSDIADRVYYPLWHHPGNKLHRLLWQLLDLSLEEVRIYGMEPQNKTMDTLLSSCPFFWASCMPWWNGIIVENAADRMLDLLSHVKSCPRKILAKAKTLREDIYREVSVLNRTGRARRLQDDFFSNKRINRKELHHLLH